jgi:hypothetical protein
MRYALPRPMAAQQKGVGTFVVAAAPHRSNFQKFTAQKNRFGYLYPPRQVLHPQLTQCGRGAKSQASPHLAGAFLQLARHGHAYKQQHTKDLIPFPGSRELAESLKVQ